MVGVSDPDRGTDGAGRDGGGGSAPGQAVHTQRRPFRVDEHVGKADAVGGPGDASHVAGIGGEEVTRLQADVVSPDACPATLEVRIGHPPSVLADRGAGDAAGDQGADPVCREPVQ